MAIQPAAGARDLNPGDVDSNRRICEWLAEVYRLWGYQEVAPPSIERLDTLDAGGGIEMSELVRLVADEPLGLRPEFTASIARAACTRMAARPRPLRLWACGSTYRSEKGAGGVGRIHERLQSGVELLGIASAAAEVELMHLLLAAVAKLNLPSPTRPTLLVGHHGLLNALLLPVPLEWQLAVRRALTDFDPLTLASLTLHENIRQQLIALMRLRGSPSRVLYQVEQWLGPIPLIATLAETLAGVEPTAATLGVRLQLDPTFQPHFDLYNGLVLKVVCQTDEGPVAIAGGGRYDGLVGRFCGDSGEAAGTGFAFDIEAIRELLGPATGEGRPAPWLVASGENGGFARSLARLRELHHKGEAAELCGHSCASKEEADAIAQERGCRGTIWVVAS